MSENVATVQKLTFPVTLFNRLQNADYVVVHKACCECTRFCTDVKCMINTRSRQVKYTSTTLTINISYQTWIASLMVNSIKPSTTHSTVHDKWSIHICRVRPTVLYLALSHSKPTRCAAGQVHPQGYTPQSQVIYMINTWPIHVKYILPPIAALSTWLTQTQ